MCILIGVDKWYGKPSNNVRILLASRNLILMYMACGLYYEWVWNYEFFLENDEIWSFSSIIQSSFEDIEVTLYLLIYE